MHLHALHKCTSVCYGFYETWSHLSIFFYLFGLCAVLLTALFNMIFCLPSLDLNHRVGALQKQELNLFARKYYTQNKRALPQNNNDNMENGLSQ